MPRIDPTITDEAKKIYDNIPNRNERGRFVSNAIVEKHSRDTGTDLETRIAELERRVKELEDTLIYLTVERAEQLLKKGITHTLDTGVRE
jgi:capsule polysaccharide modification protein KpsS